MRLFLLVCLLLLGSLCPLRSHAQTESRPVEAAPTLAALTHQDTVRALHHLFEARRRTGKRLVGAGLLTLPAALMITVGQALTSFGANDNTGEFGGALVNVGLLGGVAPGLFLKVRFRRAKEKAVVEGYEQRRVLPVPLRRKLVPKYFH